MNKKQKNTIVPKLRFPEFDEEWKNAKVEDLIEQHVEKTERNKQYPVLTSSREGIFFQKDYYNNRDVASEDTTGYNVVPRNFFTYRHMSDDLIFKFNINNICDKGIVSTLYPVFSAKEGLINSYFLQLVLNEGNEFKNFAISQKQGGSRTYMYLSKLKELVIKIPTYPEQKKIASCLSSLDDLITAHTQKLDALKAHKKGLMQQLFPVEGEKVPKLRFEEFKDNGEWKEDIMDNFVTKVGSGTTPLGGEANYIESGRPFVRSQNVGWGIFLLDDIVFISEDLHQGSISTELMLDDVLLNITGASIGRSAVVNNHVKGGNVNQHVCIIRTQKNKLNPLYLNQYLISVYGQKQIDSFQAGGNRQGLNFAQIRSFLLPIPPKLEEQKKIAIFLSSVDELITAQAEKIEQLKKHKKGLMQRLFPKIKD
jgi:type I restriction enzyme S subunit